MSSRRTKGCARHEKTGFWNEEIAVAVSEKLMLFKKWLKQDS